MSEQIPLHDGEHVARQAFLDAAKERLRPEHWELLEQTSVRSYFMCPPADEWRPLVGFAPDPDHYWEIGFLLDEGQSQSLLLARMLVSRAEIQAPVFVDWYPTCYDPRKRPLIAMKWRPGWRCTRCNGSGRETIPTTEGTDVVFRICEGCLGDGRIWVKQ